MPVTLEDAVSQVLQMKEQIVISDHLEGYDKIRRQTALLISNVCRKIKQINSTKNLKDIQKFEADLDALLVQELKAF